MVDILPIRGAAARTFTVHREYKTEIIISRRGNEQRRALRETPRKLFEIQAGMQIDLWRKVNKSVVTGQQIPWYYPDQSRVTLLAAELPAGAAPLNITTTTAPAWLQAGAAVILFDGVNLEYHTITASSPPAVLGIDTAITWPAGTRVFCAVTGYMAGELKSNRLSDKFLDVQFEFEVDPISELAETPVAAADFFQDREVFLTQPLQFAPVDLTRNQTREDVDAGQGPVTRFFPITFSQRVWQATYQTYSLEIQEILRSLQDRMVGRRGDFYMPTFEYDLPLAEAATSGTNTLTVVGTDWGDIYNGSTTWKAVCVFLPDGTVMYNSIAASPPGIATAGDNSTFTFLNNWTADIPVDAKISWMPVWRFASDGVQTDWLYAPDGEDMPVASVTLSFMQLEDLPVEVIVDEEPVVAVSYAVFNPLTATDTELTNGDLTARHSSISGATGAKVRATDAKFTGKFYVEMTVDTTGGNFSAFGIMLAIATFSDFVFFNQKGLGIILNGQIFTNGVGGANIGALSNGDVIAFAIDIDNALGWIRKSPSGDWNDDGGADPASGTGGFDLDVGGWLPVTAWDFDTEDAQVTANFGASSFVGAVPTGFTAGWTKN